MQKNVGTVDASIRITLGLLGLAYGIGKMSKRPHRTPWFLMTMSAMKVAEGVTRFCPMLYSMRMDTRTGEGLANAKKQFSKVGDNFMASQLAQFTEALGDDNTGSHPASNDTKREKSNQQALDFDLAEMVSSAMAQATQPSQRQGTTHQAAPTTQTAQATPKEQTRHVRTRENVRENLRRTKSQPNNYKQDENTYPTYS